MDKTSVEIGDDDLEGHGEAGVLTFGIACCACAIAVVLAVALGAI